MNPRSVRNLGTLPFALCLLPLGFRSSAPAAPVDFARQVQPIFTARCTVCHGARQQMNGLRLDERDAALKGGYSGVVIVPGKSAESKLLRLAAAQDPKLVMPPAGPRLTAAEIAILRAWIDEGANWPAAPQAAAAASKNSHWAFQKPRRPALPRTGVHPIDAFVRSRLEKEGITPSPEAPRHTLARRLWIDITGLPPTPGEVEEFLADTRSDAYERLVDRLLRSPHYGEKWARHWLDLGRYADSDGYEKDQSRPWAWRWRHWVIEALNRDLPFDQFTIEQMAGDLLARATTDQRVATGFHRNTLTNREGGTDPEQFRNEQVTDRVATVGTVWLGLTVGCAQCHDHKYDPITQKEFYQLFAFFNTAEETLIDAPLPGETGPHLKALPEYQRQRRELLECWNVSALQTEWEKKLLFAADHPGKQADWDFAFNAFRVMFDDAEKVLRHPERRTARQQQALTDYFIRNHRGVISKERFEQLNWKELQDTWAALHASLPPFSQAPVIAQSAEPPKTHIHLRGDWREKGIEVQPGTPAVLHSMPSGEPPTRLALARWLVSPDNPLTARVTVNRIWQELFGRGLVRTSEDFGVMGEKPAHPELLDWLAVEFRERGWSFKETIRLIATSATYRQSSGARPDLAGRDPDNALLARQSRLRLPAELVRDAALAAGGLLDLRVGGRSVRPPQPPGVAELSYANSVKWPESQGPDRYRRGLYTHFQRTTPYPQLMNFDAPSSNVACSRRQRSNTPLQALNLLNDVAFFEAAQGLAWRVHHEAPGGLREKLDHAFLVALARKPTEREVVRLTRFLDEQDGDWVALARVLLNLDEFITRE